MPNVPVLRVNGVDYNLKDTELRRDISDLENAVGGFYGNYRVVEGEIYNIYGNIMPQSLGNDMRTEKMLTKAGDQWEYHGKAAYQVAAVVYFNNDTVLGYERTNDTEVTVIFTIPENCNFVAFSSYRVPNFYVKPITKMTGLYNEIDGRINKINEQFSDIFGSYRVTEGEMISATNGSFVSNSMDHSVRTEIITAKPGDVWEYHGRADYSFLAVAYYKNGVFQSGEKTTNEQVQTKEFTVPSDCDGVAFGSYRATDFYVTPKIRTTGQKVSGNYSPDWRGKKWCAIGDSITAQYDDTTIKQYWQHIIDETGITFINCATSGRGYKNADDPTRMDAFYQKANVSRYPDLANADVITVYGSVNDCFKGYTLGDVTDTTTDTICGCVNTTISNLYICNPTAVIGIITPCPVPGMNPDNDQCEMALISAKIVEICRRRGIPCLDLYHESGFHPWDTDFRNSAYMNNDGTHPNNIGHKMMYPHFREFIKTLI